MGDMDMLQDMERLLKLSKNLPFTVVVHKPANKFTPLYRTSSLVLLQASPEMKLYRKNILRSLKINNYSVDLIERLAFYPHISIRFGVPYTESAKAMTEQSLVPETKLILNRWVILRDIKKDGKYLVKEIALDTQARSQCC